MHRIAPPTVWADCALQGEEIGKVSAAAAATFAADGAVFGQPDNHEVIAAMRRELASPLAQTA